MRASTFGVAATCGSGLVTLGSTFAGFGSAFAIGCDLAGAGCTLAGAGCFFTGAGSTFKATATWVTRQAVELLQLATQVFAGTASFCRRPSES